MADPQPGLFAQGLSQHFHLEFARRSGVSDADVTCAISAARRVATWLPGPNVTWGFSPALWRALAPADLPPSVVPFTEVRGGDDQAAPATQWDIWVWCSSSSAQTVGQTAAAIVDALEPVAELMLELPAYTAPDSRDPTGFIDGTENPLPDEAYDVAVFPDGSIGAGGSAVLIQKWVHDLPEFTALEVHDQELVIGRTREASIELPEDDMPLTSHVSRNTVLDEVGEERRIYRRNTPFDQGDEVGTQFIGVTNDPPLLTLMLERMFGVTTDGLVDRLTAFSAALTGSNYFVPAMQSLTGVFGPLKVDDDDPVAESDEDPATRATDGNLRIGSLR